MFHGNEVGYYYLKKAAIPAPNAVGDLERGSIPIKENDWFLTGNQHKEELCQAQTDCLPYIGPLLLLPHTLEASFISKLGSSKAALTTWTSPTFSTSRVL